MTHLLAFGVVFGVNLLPAFGPPTWAVLVLFRLRSRLNPVDSRTRVMPSAARAVMVDLALPLCEGARMTRNRSIFVVSGLVAAFLAVAACSSGGGRTSAATGTSPSTAAPAAADGQPATVGVANNGLGMILINTQGRTLYLFQNDSGTTSTCTGECAQDWPPLRASAPTAGSGVNAAILGTTPRSDGDPQVTYNGHPLYTFEADKKAGDTTGQGVKAFGALWYVLSPAGTQVSGSSSSSSGSGSGY